MDGEAEGPAGDVVDGDGHVYELHDPTFLDFVESPYRERAVERAEALRSHPQLTTTSDGWDRQMGGRFWDATSTSASDWLALADRTGLRAAVLYPTFGLLLGVTPDLDFAAAYARAYNDWARSELAERSGGRLVPAACIPVGDPLAAVDELVRAQELGFTVAMLPADGAHLLGTRAYDRLFEVAAAGGTCLSVHAAGTHLGGRWFPTFIQVHAFNHPASVLAQFTSIVLGGVPSLHPHLRLAFLEIGVTWLPWYLDRLDEEHEKRGDVEAPRLTGSPSDAVLGGSTFFTAEVGERLLGPVLDLFAEPQVMYASDWPHWDHEFPASLAHLRARPDLSEEQKAGLCAGAAIRCYGLDPT